MIRHTYRSWAAGSLFVIMLALAACGGGEEATPTPTAASPAPTATPAAATATAVPTAAPETADAQQVSPLPNPASPLSQPTSPLVPADDAAAQAATAPVASQPVAQGPHIDIAVPSDLKIITQLANETKAPAPQEGMASLSGVLYSPGINRIIPGTQFYLTPAIEDNGQLYIPTMFVGPQLDKGDVAGISNEKGQIMLDNIPPGNYYMPVWAIYNWPLAFGAKDDKLPLMITLKAGEQRDLGLLYVEWP